VRAKCYARRHMAPSDEAIPAVIEDLAASCVRFVTRAVGIELDYTPETLPILDHYLREARGVAKEDSLKLVAPAAGAYFGEVVRRHLGKVRWHLEGDEYEAMRVEFVNCFLSFNPIGMALEALLGEEVQGYGSHFELLREDRNLVQEALERAGTVRDEDYFRLAIRYEVIELVASLLIERTAQENEGNEREFAPEVYAALRDKTPPVLH
jgi:hypothetical protein